MLKYFAKIFKDIFPSVLATVIGAYIVNHYIVSRPATDAAVATTAPATKDTASAGGSTEVAHQPSFRVRAKGISEKAVAEKLPVEKPANKAAEQLTENKPTDAKPSDAKPAETVAVHGRQPSSREKTIAKMTPAPVIAAPAATLAVEADPAPASSAAAAIPDANVLARAAIERLRKSSHAVSHDVGTAQGSTQETAHASEVPRGQEAQPIVAAAPAIRPLPQPITVPPPAFADQGALPANPSYTASVDADAADRPTPPADIPVSVVSPRLSGDSARPTSRAGADGNVAEEILSAAKSVLHVVQPKTVTSD